MKLNNKYYMLRHGEAVSNTKDTMSCWPETFENPLTDNGVAMIEKAARVLQEKKINIIFASDILRTKLTAQIVARELNVEIIFDQRLREIDFGTYNGKSVWELEKVVDGSPLDIAELYRRVKPGGRMLGYRMSGGEDYQDVQDRMAAFLQDINSRYAGKTMVIISHQSPLWLLEERVKGIKLMEIGKKIPSYEQMHTGEVRELTAI